MNNELESLDTEIAALKADIAAIQRERLSASNEVTEGERTRGTLALAARKDESARAELEQARRRAIEGKLILEEKQAALEQATAQLTELEHKRTEAFRSAKIAEYEAETDALVTEAQQLEAAVSALLTTKAKFDERLHGLDALGAAAGFSRDDMRHQNVSKNIRRGIAHRVDYSTIWLPPDAKKLYSMPLHDLVRHVLNKGAVDEEPSKLTIQEGENNGTSQEVFA
jgi:chromosome segregation ATPase